MDFLVSSYQSPLKSKRGKGAKKGQAGMAELELAGVLHIMKLLAAGPPAAEGEASPTPAVVSPRRRSAAAGAAEAPPLQPALVTHLVDGLFDQYADPHHNARLRGSFWKSVWGGQSPSCIVFLSGILLQENSSLVTGCAFGNTYARLLLK